MGNLFLETCCNFCLFILALIFGAKLSINCRFVKLFIRVSLVFFFWDLETFSKVGIWRFESKFLRCEYMMCQDCLWAQLQILFTEL